MNNTVTRLSDLAWSKLENISRVRKFLQGELDHSHSFPSGISLNNFEQGLDKIDRFTADFSRFLSIMRSRRQHPDVLEEQFDELSAQYAGLMQELESLVRP